MDWTFIGTFFTSLFNLSTITKGYSFRHDVLIKSPRISIRTDFNETSAGAIEARRHSVSTWFVFKHNAYISEPSHYNRLTVYASRKFDELDNIISDHLGDWQVWHNVWLEGCAPSNCAGHNLGPCSPAQANIPLSSNVGTERVSELGDRFSWCLRRGGFRGDIMVDIGVLNIQEVYFLFFIRIFQGFAVISEINEIQGEHFVIITLSYGLIIR